MTNLQLFLVMGIPVLFNPPARDFWLRDPRHIAGALVRRRPVGDLASWQERQSFRNLTREYSPLGSVPYLEGVVVSSPYVDVRVVPLALCGMKHQPRPSASRSFLAATVAARIGGANMPSRGVRMRTRFERILLRNPASRNYWRRSESCIRKRSEPPRRSFRAVNPEV